MRGVQAEFRRREGAPNEWATFKTDELPTVPLPGEIVNLSDDPYYVVRREWAVGREDHFLYAYIYVTRIG